MKKSHDTVLAELEELNKVYQHEQSKVLGLKSEIHQSSSKERAIMEVQNVVLFHSSISSGVLGQ